MQENEIGQLAIELLKITNNVLVSFSNKLCKNSFQIQTLEKLGNNLLPKLISGEVRGIEYLFY